MARGHKIDMLEAADAMAKAVWVNPWGRPGGISYLRPASRQGNQAMTKAFEVISEAIRDPKPPFRKMDSQRKKPLKHRYERRKVRSCLHSGEWSSAEPT